LVGLIDTAVGPDRISCFTVRQLHSIVPRVVPDLFNAMPKFGVHPPEWKVANYVIIPKNGKANYKLPTSCRPISLLSCFGKVFEASISRRMADAAVRCGAISNSQLGGVQQNSAIDVLIYTTTPMNIALRQPLKKRKTKAAPKPT
jgi:hypothetical protein